MKGYTHVCAAGLLLLGTGPSIAQTNLLGTILNAARQAHQRQLEQQRQQQQGRSSPNQAGGAGGTSTIDQGQAQALSDQIGRPPPGQPDCTLPANYNTAYCQQEAAARAEQQQGDAIKLRRAREYFKSKKDKWVIEKAAFDQNGQLLASDNADMADMMNGDLADSEFYTGEQCATVVAKYVRDEVAAYLAKGVIFKRMGEATYKLVGSEKGRYVNPNPMVSASEEMLLDNPATRKYRSYVMFMCVQEKHTDTDETQAYVSTTMDDQRASSLKLFPDFRAERDH